MSSVEQFGQFNDKEGCFELCNEPPRKWINLHYNKVGDDEVYAEISNIGDGPISVRDKDGVKVNLVSYDSKYLYIRDDESGTTFCPWGAPAPQDAIARTCKFYAAKTVTTGTCEELKATQRVFVPHDYLMEIWTVTIENTSNRPRTVSLFAYAMFQLTGNDKEGNGVGKENYSDIIPEIGGVFITNRSPFVPTDRFKGYLVALNDFRAGSGYRDHFLRSEFSAGTPKILWGWNGDNKPGYGPDCAGTVQVTLDIPPGETGRADFLIGQAASVDEVKAVRSELTPEKIDAMCVEQEQLEAERAGKFLVKTGNDNYDSLMNVFVKKQLYSYLINKSGFRDNMQLDNAICLCDYEAARSNVVRALASQYPNGCVPHGFRPLIRLQYSDKPAWTMLTIPGLLKESGDFSLLEEEVPYLESAEKGSVYDHMLRAMRFLADDTGKNGLCDQHHADWNDGLEATQEAGERESVMVSMQLCYGAREVAEVARRIGDKAVEKEALQIYDTFKSRINEVAWDGEWYVRTICGDGYRIGSKENKEGKIFLNTQSWAILSGVADDERAALCMSSVDTLLTEEVGYRICAPGFSQYDPRVGRMSSAIPGQNENGGCYNHAAGFKGVADCMLGRSEQAWETFVKVAPDNPANPVSQSQVEPFSFTNSYSMYDRVYGRSGYPWRTGTAAWFTVLLIEWILGARRGYDGLVVAPCLPGSMPKARVVRSFRGATYDISLDNSAGRGTGVTSITVDGGTVEGNTLPLLDSGTHQVEVVI